MGSPTLFFLQIWDFITINRTSSSRGSITTNQKDFTTMGSTTTDSIMTMDSITIDQMVSITIKIKNKDSIITTLFQTKDFITSGMKTMATIRNSTLTGKNLVDEIEF